jgi:hypothetical protein
MSAPFPMQERQKDSTGRATLRLQKYLAYEDGGDNRNQTDQHVTHPNLKRPPTLDAILQRVLHQ